MVWNAGLRFARGENEDKKTLGLKCMCEKKSRSDDTIVAAGVSPPYIVIRQFSTCKKKSRSDDTIVAAGVSPPYRVIRQFMSAVGTTQ
jgi:hypothetical protein